LEVEYALALSGAVSAVVAHLIVRGKRERIGVGLVVSLALFISLISSAKRLIDIWDVNTEMNDVPFFKTLSVSDPAAYQRVKDILLEAARSGETTESAALRIADALQEIVPRYIPRASDDSVIAFANVTIHDLDELDRTNGDACYGFLYPHKYARAGLAAKYLGGKSREKDLDALFQIVETAVKQPQPEPSPEASNKLLEPIQTNLYQKYGKDLMLLQEVARDSAERKYVILLWICFIKSLRCRKQTPVWCCGHYSRVGRRSRRRSRTKSLRFRG
jgi:hypothetical protein